MARKMLRGGVKGHLPKKKSEHVTYPCLSMLLQKAAPHRSVSLRETSPVKTYICFYESVQARAKVGLMIALAGRERGSCGLRGDNGCSLAGSFWTDTTHKPVGMSIMVQLRKMDINPYDYSP